jgi:hypothetical protein
MILLGALCPNTRDGTMAGKPAATAEAAPRKLLLDVFG